MPESAEIMDCLMIMSSPLDGLLGWRGQTLGARVMGSARGGELDQIMDEAQQAPFVTDLVVPPKSRPQKGLSGFKGL